MICGKIHPGEVIDRAEVIGQREERAEGLAGAVRVIED